MPEGLSGTDGSARKSPPLREKPNGHLILDEIFDEMAQFVDDKIDNQ